MGLLGKIAANPAAANMMLMGLGLLGSKKRSQADRYIGGLSQGLLDQAQWNRGAEEREQNKRLRDEQIKQAQMMNQAPGMIETLIGQPAGEYRDPVRGEAMFQTGSGFLYDKDPMKLAAGLASVPGQAQTGIGLLADLMEPQKLTSLQENLAAAGLTPGSPEYEEAILKILTKPQTSIFTGKWWPEGTYPVDINDPTKGVKQIPGDPGSSEEAKTATIATSAIDNLDELMALEESGDIDQWTLAASDFIPDIFNIFFSDNVQQFKTGRDDLADQIGRWRSGGAINKEEEARFLSQLPEFGDSKTTRLWKLNRLKNQFTAMGLVLRPSAFEEKDEMSVDEIIKYYENQ